MAEVEVTTEASKEVVWFKKFLEEMDVISSRQGLMELFCDNSTTISQIKEPESHHRTKYSDRKYYEMKDINEKAKLYYCGQITNGNTADPLTKSLSQASSEVHYETMGLQDHGQWNVVTFLLCLVFVHMVMYMDKL